LRDDGFHKNETVYLLKERERVDMMLLLLN